MEKIVEILNRQVQVTLSETAIKALSNYTGFLTVEMELYFSCLIRKKVRFADDKNDKAIKVTDNLAVLFRPVMTATCGIDYEGDEPPLTDFPIEKPEAFVPKWLKIDYKKDKWQGEFGF